MRGPVTEETITILPYPRSAMPGATARAIRNAVESVRASSVSQSEGSSSRNGRSTSAAPVRAIPALQTSTSTRAGLGGQALRLRGVGEVGDVARRAELARAIVDPVRRRRHGQLHPGGAERAGAGEADPALRAGARDERSRRLHPTRAATASANASVWRSTSAAVVAGDISAMLWNGVISTPRLSSARCR